MSIYAEKHQAWSGVVGGGSRSKWADLGLNPGSATLCSWSLAVIGLLDSSVLRSVKWGTNILNHSGLLYESDEVSLWTCWKFSADLRVPKSGRLLGGKDFQCKNWKNWDGWSSCSEQSILPTSHCKDPAQFKQLPQYSRTFSAVEGNLFLFVCFYVD